MFKKILVITGLLFSLVPITNAFAQEGGLINGKSVQVYSDLVKYTTSYKVTDNDTTTNENLYSASRQKAIKITFSSPVDLTNMYLVSSGGTPVVTFFDNDDETNNGSVARNNTATNSHLITRIATKTSMDIDVKNVKTVYLYSNYYSDTNIKEIDFSGKAAAINYQNIESLNLSVPEKTNEIDLNWTAPESNGSFVSTRIYRNGEEIANVDKGTNSYKDSNLEYGKTYKYKVTAVYADGEETVGITKDITIPELPKPVEDVTQVNVSTTYERVDLSWKLPNTDKLKHVNIYRRTLEEEQQTSMIENFVFGTKAYAAEEPEKIFETNGTYLNDLTVEPSTKYEYTLKTVSDSELESEGVIVNATTKAEPAPEIEGGELQKDENGDYTYTWEEPTKGEVRVLVGGKEYKTVSAAEQKITIPAADMEYNDYGAPDIKLIPVSEYGTIGKPEDIGNSLGVKTPFGVSDLIKTGSNLLWWIAPFILLGLAFFLVPKLRNLITRPFKKGGDGEKDGTAASEGNERTRTTGVRERQLRTPTIRRERAEREQRVSRISIKEPRPEREGTKQGRLPREIRKGR